MPLYVLTSRLKKAPTGNQKYEWLEDDTGIVLFKLSLVDLDAEMQTGRKQTIVVQRERLSERGSIEEYATVRSIRK